MKNLIKGELIKIASTRTLFGFLAAGVALTVLNVVIIAQASGPLDEVGEKEEALSSLPILLLLLGLVGAAGEYRHRTAAPAALVARHGRGSLLLARTGAYSVTGLVVGTLLAGVSVGLGLPLLSDQPGPDLGAGEVTAVVAGCLTAGVLFTVIGVALGALIRNQTVGAVAALLLTFVLNPLLGVIDGSAAAYTPAGAASLLARMTRRSPLSLDGAALVLAAWAVALVAVAVVLERRRDLT